MSLLILFWTCMESSFDFLYKGGCLDNVFSPAYVLINSSRLLNNNGRVLHYESASRLLGAFTFVTSEWFCLIMLLIISLTARFTSCVKPSLVCLGLTMTYIFQLFSRNYSFEKFRLFTIRMLITWNTVSFSCCRERSIFYL